MIPRARHLAAAALSGALLMLPVFAGVSDASAASKVYKVALTKTRADVQRVANYWKPEQLKKADSYSPATPSSQPAPVAKAASGGAVNAPIGASGSALRTSQAVTPAPPTKGAARTMGKVYFRFGNKEYWCSASSVAAKNHSVVATAAHCAYDARQGNAAAYWIFVPNPGSNGEAPDGIYVGSSISMHEDWPGKNDYDYDYAFVTVHRGFTWQKQGDKYVAKDVGQLQDNVGGLGLELSRRSPLSDIHAFGYAVGPQPDGSRPFNGLSLQPCVGSTRKAVAPGLDLNFGVQLAPATSARAPAAGPGCSAGRRTRSSAIWSASTA